MDRKDEHYDLAIILVTLVAGPIGALTIIFGEDKILLLGFLSCIVIIILDMILGPDYYKNFKDTLTYLIATSVWFTIVSCITGFFTMLVLTLFFQKEKISIAQLKDPQVVENKICGINERNKVDCIPASSTDIYYIQVNRPDVINVKVTTHVAGKKISLYKDYEIITGKRSN